MPLSANFTDDGVTISISAVHAKGGGGGGGGEGGQGGGKGGGQPALEAAVKDPTPPIAEALADLLGLN